MREKKKGKIGVGIYDVAEMRNEGGKEDLLHPMVSLPPSFLPHLAFFFFVR